MRSRPSTASAREELAKITEIFSQSKKHPIFGAWLESARADFEELKSQSLRRLEDLETEQEPKITIALFGETNAGKSTLIEALRLFFNEPSKALEQRLFQEAQEDTAPLADGAIIDAHIDFTQAITPYTFTLANGGGEVTLLDMPGIEGDEAQVEEFIKEACAKAHVIFYISKNPTPPQEGTLQKIKSYLNDQSRVYFFHNRGVTNPKLLQKPLVGGEKHALEDADAKMREVLGPHYQGHRSVCAYVAFLALAKCLDPKDPKGCDFLFDQQEFLRHKSAPELLEWSHFNDSCDLLHHIAKQQQEIVYQAQCYKAFCALQRCTKSAHQALHTMQECHKAFKESVDLKIPKLDLLCQKTLVSLKKELDNLIVRFKNASEDAMYRCIYGDMPISILPIRTILPIPTLSDEGFEAKTKEVLKEQAQVFAAKVKNTLEVCERQFKAGVEDLLREIRLKAGVLKRHGADFDKHGHNFSDHTFKTDSGFDWSSLLGAGMTFASLFMLEGVVALAVFTALGVYLLYKALRKAVDDDYKRSEQRKTFDKTLDHALKCLKCAVGLMGRKEVQEEIQKTKAKLEDLHFWNISDKQELEGKLKLAQGLLSVLEKGVLLEGVRQALEKCQQAIGKRLEEMLEQGEGLCADLNTSVARLKACSQPFKEGSEGCKD
ncbi:hypothetical protein NHP21005_14870 [Helicobacter sp. NHP21005]|uniref:GTPase n=1 Tax=Helicobacter felistomachi TaxID=3040201 RepID=UPI00257252ED|nr:GTPase domain-containing protein [Helicobacter sp. NHP21005]BEG57799.1 hypothetical protein NHP21005_14870 [Helicobacter sp. NHP21005]